MSKVYTRTIRLASTRVTRSSAVDFVGCSKPTDVNQKSEVSKVQDIDDMSSISSSKFYFLRFPLISRLTIVVAISTEGGETRDLDTDDVSSDEEDNDHVNNRAAKGFIDFKTTMDNAIRRGLTTKDKLVKILQPVYKQGHECVYRAGFHKYRKYKPKQYWPK